MNYEIVWDDKVIEFLNKLEQSIAKRIINKVNELSLNPFNKDIRKLVRSNKFRLRVGDYRIIFSILRNKINVLKVGHRKNIYSRD